MTAPLVVAAATGLMTALGGFEAARQPAPPRVAAGQVIDQGLFRTKVRRAYVGRRHDLISDPGKRWLTAEFRVVNTSDETLDVTAFATGPARCRAR